MESTKHGFVPAIQQRIAQVVVGQEIVVERLLIALFTGGHILLEGLPGLAKTLLANTLANSIELQFKRVQFTIDLLPSDILGSEVLNPRDQTFTVQKGPIFTHLLLADEINRAAPKVQSALLEAMQERKVTIGGQGLPLPAPFLVIATQNPVEQSGTFELPEAQLDRFMLCHRLHYPKREEEEDILKRMLRMGLKREKEGAIPQTAFDSFSEESPATLSELTEVMEDVQKVHVSDVFLKHCVDLVGQTREHPDLELGASPRASMALVQAARARALIHRREYVVPEDLFALAEDVILHRVRLTYTAQAQGKRGRDLIDKLLMEVTS
ncbi:MAG: AAA family ATPase [Limisphaerales bacterium]|jgi:MoxR-like ATPase